MTVTPRTVEQQRQAVARVLSTPRAIALQSLDPSTLAHLISAVRERLDVVLAVGSSDPAWVHAQAEQIVRAVVAELRGQG